MNKLENIYRNTEKDEDFITIIEKVKFQNDTGFWNVKETEQYFDAIDEAIEDKIRQLWGKPWDFQQANNDLLNLSADCDYLRKRIATTDCDEFKHTFFALCLEYDAKYTDLNILIEAIKGVKALADYSKNRLDLRYDDYSIDMTTFYNTRVNGSWVAA